MEIIKGRRQVYTASIKEGDVAFDLSGYEAELVLSRGVGLVPTLKKPGTVAPAGSGNVEFTLLPEDLVNAESGHYRFEVNIWRSGDTTSIFTPVEGSVILRDALDESPAVS